MNEDEDPYDAIRTIEKEMLRFSPELAEYERWLVINKIDLLPDEEREEKCQDLVKRLDWKGRVFNISAISKQGTKELCYEIMDYVEQQKQLAEETTEQVPESVAEKTDTEQQE